MMTFSMLLSSVTASGVRLIGCPHVYEASLFLLASMTAYKEQYRRVLDLRLCRPHKGPAPILYVFEQN